ncbi:Thioredoxin-like fold protein [Niveomyces insectorum RCEF 264]|uniref:Thioredoxin-like fold protein n=1 Tax=Niveomyces insectorum RCEF 264 TaxID=1081102 RepID=A0A167ZZR5_9HYPO|nr:Thioredoxin-like fold protein [Niveomyces insectorum RCEF 264]
MAASADAPPAADAVADKTNGDTDQINPPDFDGAVRTNNKLPSPDTLRRIADLPVLDRAGKSHPFRSLYEQPGRTLVIFVRHFFCGNCQEYLRALSEAVPTTLLATAAVPTRIVVVGCGEPPLIDMYAEAAACPYPVYADPTRRLYDVLGMVSTLALGAPPGYMQRTSLWRSSLRSIGQGLRQIPRGLALKGGNQRQVGGEFLFERRQPPAEGADANAHANANAHAADVTVTWCHRMTTTRDHAEPEQIRTLLALKSSEAAKDGADAKKTTDNHSVS